jgi:5-methylcytosine-specific restriction endonuclease McrA
MSFSETTVNAAWDRAGGKCETCKKQLSFDNRGREGRGKWEAHHKKAAKDGGADTLSNCKILCFECHKNTKSFGN